MQPIPQSSLADFFFGSMTCSAVRWREEKDIVQRGLDWTLSLGDSGIYHLPLFLVIDMGIVLQHGFDTRFDESLWPEEFRDVQIRYERFLSQLLQESSVIRAMEIAHFGPQKPARLCRLIVLLMRSFAPHFPRSHVSNPAHTRRVVTPNLEALDVEFHAEQFTLAINDATFFQESLRKFLEEVDARIRWSKLLQTEDFFELNHWESLGTEHLRLGCRQILEVERRLGNVDTRRIEVQDEDSNSDTIFEDETSFPAGGISELTHHGDFENLVLSELVYMNTGESDPDEIDLFDIRFVEGELLFFKRDSGQLRRRRRSIHFIFDMGSLFFGKSIGYEYRFAMLSQGLAISLARDLARVFEIDSIHTHFHFVSGVEESLEALEQEARVLSELMADEIRHGWVSVNVHQTIATSELQDLTRKTYALAITDAPEKWNVLFEKSRRESPPIHGLTIGVTDEAELELVLPLSGLEFENIISVRDRTVAKLAGGR